MLIAEGYNLVEIQRRLGHLFNCNDQKGVPKAPAHTPVARPAGPEAAPRVRTNQALFAGGPRPFPSFRATTQDLIFARVRV
jgi:hypothetical protein